MGKQRKPRRSTRWMAREAERMRQAIELRNGVRDELPDDPTVALVAGVALSAMASQDPKRGETMRSAGAMLIGAWFAEFATALGRQ
jgi:hypothetical protein